jgi:hypothetical protein
MHVQRMIDDQIRGHTLDHSSKGCGRDRVLVITKNGFDSPAQMQKKQEL